MSSWKVCGATDLEACKSDKVVCFSFEVHVSYICATSEYLYTAAILCCHMICPCIQDGVVNNEKVLLILCTVWRCNNILCLEDRDLLQIKQTNLPSSALRKLLYLFEPWSRHKNKNTRPITFVLRKCFWLCTDFFYQVDVISGFILKKKVDKARELEWKLKSSISFHEITLKRCFFSFF